jgi:hypothetical protein
MRSSNPPWPMKCSTWYSARRNRRCSSRSVAPAMLSTAMTPA